MCIYLVDYLNFMRLSLCRERETQAKLALLEKELRAVASKCNAWMLPHPKVRSVK